VKNNKLKKTIEPEVEYNIQENPDEEDESLMGDIYDIIAETIEVHTKGTLINKDYTMSAMTRGERFFVKETLKVIRQIRDTIPYKPAADDVIKMMREEITVVVVLSRTDKNPGKVIDAMLKAATRARPDGDEGETTEQKPKNEGFLKKAWHTIF
jgi:hypothetical protein